jgi:phospholipase C
LALRITNDSSHSQIIEINDNAYSRKELIKKIPASGRKTVVLDLNASHGWYDVSMKVKGKRGFSRRYAGRVETGAERISDPAMGGV